MKKYYCLVVSVLDKDWNRVDSHPITGGNDKKEILTAREVLDRDIEAGKYDKFKIEGHTLSADIEVHNDETWELLYLM